MLWNEEMIRAELRRLDEITGLCSRDIPIIFNASKCCLGSFCVADGKPKAFYFSIRYFMDEDGFAHKEGVNVIRHEYAHFMEHAIYGGIKRGKPHGPRWKECCAIVGARPQAFYQTSQNEMQLSLEKKEAEKAAAMQAFMDTLELGDVFVHPTFGEGTLLAIDGETENKRLEIVFACGKRRLAAAWTREHCRHVKEGEAEC